ncbi:MAG: flavin reductase family protein [Acidilobaceae archaeon]
MSQFERLQDGAEFYRMLHPRPVVLIVTRCPNGKLNVMSASWVTPVSEEPPLLAVAISKESYTTLCLEHSLEATLNIPGAEHADLVYKAGSVSGREIDKVSQFGMRLEESLSVSTPHWADALGYIEVRVRHRIDAGESWLYLFEVVVAHVRSELWSKWGWKSPQAGPLLHGIGKAFYKPGQMILSRG